MADKNNLMPRNLNMLRLTPEDLALMEMTNSGFDPSFERRMQAQMLSEGVDRPMVRPSFSLMGSSGGYNMQMPNGQMMPYMPANVNARFGLEGDVGAGQLRGGVAAGATQAANDRLRFMPPTADVGYSTPFAGGQLDLSAMSPIERANLSKMMLNARYSRSF
jgi:hypothetical protein